ncbi:hypothetical protein ABZV75_37445 [Streptomyces flaveolus]|uniref:hypothetical protein n=1 Tax=Streptomyces flaveolus TaxID=67297 RepID=UPI0033AEE964
MTTADTTTKTHTRARRRWPLTAAAATVLATGGLITWQMTQTTASAAPTTSLNLTTRPSDGTTRCPAPTIETLRTNTTAFEGTATSVKGDRVTLHVTQWYYGTAASTVTILHKDRLEDLTFTTGGHYLVAAKNRVVEPCGGTVGADHHMRDLYERAFPER